MSTGLLSRIAETLFWIGRYVERADDTARILDVHLHRMLEEPSGDVDAGCRALSAILGVPPGDGRIDIGTVLSRLAYDDGTPSAIAGALQAARTGGRSVREVISTEMWECLNVTWHELDDRRRAAERLGPHVFLRYVRERAALFSGLADATMSRDEGWHFLVLGRSVERIDMTARLLSLRMPSASYAPDWSMLLRASGADESYIRTHGGTGEPRLVAAFLLLDRLFPRSVLHVLTLAEDCLAVLDPDPARAGFTDAARRPIGRLRTRLEYTDAAQLLEQLPELLTALQHTCVRATEAVADKYFQYALPVAWEQEG
ncbi:putative alpha-E superfamily protein [Actinocorallia herbida]|uniref:Putative alpha-E superfamily protein n=1 Tax=Actinocorallia herbida TaxID=58109 RepID=A0A3N1CRA8_9ACTN|nr:alpha-E domain-containing protein [Actinocorallia herbida]ROO83735.1 putative alpha-E superfamily protein [Actinocorallia herbida]